MGNGRLHLALALGIAIAPGAAASQAPPASDTAHIRAAWLIETGRQECSSWTRSKAENEWGRYVHVSWLAAFLGELDGDILRYDDAGEGLDPGIIDALMDDRCAARPSETLEKAARSVAAEMIERNRRSDRSGEAPPVR